MLVALNDVRLGVERWPGRTVIQLVFLHGLGDGSFVWRDVVPRLRAQLASMAIDLRGHGRSDWDTDGNYSLADHAVDMCRIIWHFGLDRVLLIGHSMGAAVALRVAAHLGESVVGLVLIDYGQTFPNSAHEWIARELTSARRTFTTQEEFAQELQSGRPFARFDILRRYAAASLRPSPDGRWVVTASQDEFKMFGYPVLPPVVETVAAGAPADRGGLKPGDNILSYDGVPIGSWYQVTDLVSQRHDHPVQVSISRNGHTMNLMVRPEHKDLGDGAGLRWSVGILPHLDSIQRDRGIIDSVSFSLWFNQRLARQMLDLVGQLFVGRVSLKEVQGPVGIVTMSGKAARAGFGSLMSMMALISLNLAVVNLLPFPILDGGHITMLAIEGALRHDLSIKAKERFIQVGFVFILVVFALVMYNDVLRLFQHS